MKRIWVVLTTDRRVLCISAPSEKRNLLRPGERIEKDFFYHLPRGLESFFLANPEEQALFPKGFAYWVICRAFGSEENQDLYGLLKRKISEYSTRLFRAVRGLAGRIANEIKKFQHIPIGRKKARSPQGIKKKDHYKNRRY
jgi:hypothetical protein